MSTAYGRGMADLLGEFDTMESEVKAERQQLAAFQRAENGQPPVGVRLTGYTMADVVVEREAAAVRQMFTRFHAGDSLRGIVSWLTEHMVPTRSGRPWSPSSVRTIITNPRYTGRVVHRGQYPGEVNGKMGAWPPLVEEWLFDAVQAKLSDPRRRNDVGVVRFGVAGFGAGRGLVGLRSHGGGQVPQGLRRAGLGVDLVGPGADGCRPVPFGLVGGGAPPVTFGPGVGVVRQQPLVERVVGHVPAVQPFAGHSPAPGSGSGSFRHACGRWMPLSDGGREISVTQVCGWPERRILLAVG